MPKGPDGQKRPADIVGCAVAVAKIATGEIEEITITKSGCGRSGRAGAKACTESLTKEEHREIAKKAAVTSWG